MVCHASRVVAVSMLLAFGPSVYAADTSVLAHEAGCQRKIASQGARFAMKALRANLKCAEETVDCQVKCESGIFGTCDPDDPGSNQAYSDCLDDAQGVCDDQAQKVLLYEATKQASITTTCSSLTTEELCGANAEGLSFATLNAGCAALDPNYTCNLTNLVNCVGGPLEQQLLGQISAVLNPRLPDGLAAINRQIPGVPTARRASGMVAAGKADLWAISGLAGDQIIVRVKTKDDTGTDVSTLHPELALYNPSANALVPNVNPVNAQCPVANACGASCRSFKRALPDDGTFDVVVKGVADGACGGGRYKLIVVSPSGTAPTLVADDVTPP